MTVYFAQPYDISANGFYFEDYEDYTRKRFACRNDFGQTVEEFEIQFIDGDEIDAILFRVSEVNQATLEGYLDTVDHWDDYEKQRIVIAVEAYGYDAAMQIVT